jgi:hypothetical protein
MPVWFLPVLAFCCSELCLPLEYDGELAFLLLLGFLPCLSQWCSLALYLCFGILPVRREFILFLIELKPRSASNKSVGHYLLGLYFLHL